MPYFPLVKSAKISAFVFCLLTCGFYSGTWADERADFRVNDDGGTASQTTPRIAIAGDQGFAIVWVDRRSGNNDIYLQRFDSSGYAIGSNTITNDDATGSYQSEPSIAADLFGKYAAVWRDYRNGTYPYQPDIYLQRFDSVLTGLGSNVNVTSACSEPFKESPDVAIGRSGAGLVVWSDYRNGDWDIYGQRFSSDGALQGTALRINDDLSGYQQHSPSVSVSSMGWYVVTWYDNRSGNDDIFIQRLDSLGSPLGINIKVNSDSQGKRQAFPDVAIDSAGQFAVAWIDWRNGSYPLNPDIFMRRFDSIMTPLASEIQVNAEASLSTLRKPALAADRVGNMIVAWSDSTSSLWNVMGQIVNSDGEPVGSNFCLSTDNDNNQLDPDVVIDGEYCYAVWTDNRNGNWDIYASIARYHQPTLTVSTDYVYFVMQQNGRFPSGQDVIVSHSGTAGVAYSVSCQTSWLEVTPASGSSVDTVSISISDSTLQAGSHFATIVFVDAAAGDSSADLSVRLDVLSLPEDTISIDPAMVETNETGSTPITASIDNEAGEITLALQYVIGDLTVDSVRAGPTLPAGIDLVASIDADGGLVAIEWQADSVFTPGEYYLADLFFTAGAAAKTASIEAVVNDTLSSTVYVGTMELTPIVNAGEINISEATGVGDELTPEVPDRFRLAQNWPNPFNLSTIICYDLPDQANVTLEVFNVLGQRVTTLQSGVKPAGTHRVRWDGRAADGHTVPSGVYFYRLRSEEISLVRKALLVK